MSGPDIGLAFVLLQNGVAPAGTAISTRAVDADATDLRVGIDTHGFRHLLAPIENPVREDRSSAALVLSSRVLTTTTGDQLFADLYCTDTRLGLVFERLASDVHDRIAAGTSGESAVSAALNDWRDLFRAGSGPSIETVLGLVGELVILEKLAQAVGHKAALDSWWGPDGHMHDFYSATGRAIEVKTTRSLEGNRIHVSNAAQLDPDDVTSLHLAVIRTKPDRTSPTLDDRIAALLASGFPAAELLTKIERGGYVFEGPVSVDTRYAITSDRWWRVTEDFPGIRESRINSSHLKGVTAIKYELALDAAAAELDAASVTAIISGWEG